MKPKKNTHVWVVEIKDAHGRWAPCADAQLTREDGRRSLVQYWLANNPDDDFRVTKYTPPPRSQPI